MLVSCQDSTQQRKGFSAVGAQGCGGTRAPWRPRSVPGARNYRGYCKKTFCERVNTTKEETVEISKNIARSAVDRLSQPDNLRAVAHKSGAFILTGGASALSANLATTGSTLATALATPAALAATGVSVVAVGGAVYMCSGEAEVSSDG